MVAEALLGKGESLLDLKVIARQHSERNAQFIFTTVLWMNCLL